MPKFRVQMEFTIDTEGMLVDDKRQLNEDDVCSIFLDALESGDIWDNPKPTTLIVSANILN